MNIAYVYADTGTFLADDEAIAIHARACVEALADAGHRVTVFCRQDAPPPRSWAGSKTIHRVGVAFERLAAGLRRRLRQAVTAGGRRPFDRVLVLRAVDDIVFNLPLRRAIEAAHRADPFDLVLECHSLWHFGGQWAARRCGVPHLLEVHGPTSREAELFYGISMPRLARWLERRTWRRADAVVAISGRVKDILLSAGVAAERVSVRSPGVRLADFSRLPSGDAVRRRHRLEGHLVAGFLGSFGPWHGLDLLPGLMTALRAGGDRWRLLLVGDGPERERILAALEASGHRERVVWTGAVPHAEIPAHLAAMDAALNPAHHGPTDYFAPQKLFEYMAAGLPVVASRWGTSGEFLSHGRTGLLAAPGDAEDFAAQLERLAADRPFARTLGEAARLKALDVHTYEGTARLIAELGDRLRTARPAPSAGTSGRRSPP